MKNFLLYIWQLPQNLLGLLVIFFSKAEKSSIFENVYYTDFYFGVSLGKYIILEKKSDLTDIGHEQGHQIQSQILGWLYLPIVGLTSAVFNNLWDRIFHKKWTTHDRLKWYYSRFPEKWADDLGGVKRT